MHFAPLRDRLAICAIIVNGHARYVLLVLTQDRLSVEVIKEAFAAVWSLWRVDIHRGHFQVLFDEGSHDCRSELLVEVAGKFLCLFGELPKVVLCSEISTSLLLLFVSWMKRLQSSVRIYWHCSELLLLRDLKISPAAGRFDFDEISVGLLLPRLLSANLGGGLTANLFSVSGVSHGLHELCVGLHDLRLYEL